MQTFFSSSVRRFLLVLVLLALAPALAIISISALERHRDTLAQAQSDMRHLVDSLTLHQESLVISTRQFLSTLSKIPAIQNHDRTASFQLLNELHKQNPHYVNILLADTSGIIYANAQGVPGFSVADRKYFKDVLATNRFSAGEYVISRSTNKPVLNYAAPVFDAKEQLVAVVIVGLDVSYYDRLLQQTNLPVGTTITLTDHRGTILHRSPRAGSLPGSADPNFDLMRGQGESGIFRSDSANGLLLNAWKQLSLDSKTVPYLYIRLSTPEAEATHGITLVALRDIALLILAATLALLITWILGNRGIVLPTRLMVDTANQIRNGNLKARIPLTSAPYELEQLIERFNAMAATLEEREAQQSAMLQELRMSEDKYRIVADFTVDCEYWLNAEQQIIYMSPATLELTGYSREAFYDDPDLLFRIIHPDDRDWMVAHSCNTTADHLICSKDIRIITREGEERWVSHTCQPVFDSTGAPRGRRGCNRDITDRKQAEQALLLKSAELTELNRTLQERIDEELRKNREKDRLMMIQGRQASMGEMISNIAHQWRQPLNNLGLMIQGLLIDHDFGELDRNRLQESVTSGMELIQFMSSTIDDFRNFFKPNKQKSRFNLQTVTRRAMGFVAASLEESRIEARLEIVHDTDALGYPNECSQVLINLLGNARDALQERRPQEPCIVITIDRSSDGALISVADNGGGIPENVLDRVFEPYFTTKEQGKGSGIGLYMAKTIIEKNMGGTLSVANSSRLNGAVFTIVLPYEPETPVSPPTFAPPA